MRIKYNAPTTLTYAFFCTLVVALDQFVVHGITRTLFSVPNALAFDPTKPLNYLRLFTHIAGHADWNHLLGNMAYVLLLGPMLEETYGSLTMFLMIVVTGFVTGVLNACFFPNPLLGASGVVFMMILLASFTNTGKDDIPLTFILIMILYLGREILNAFRGDDISQFAHLAGGLCGSLFGFFKPVRTVTYRVDPTEAARPSAKPRTPAKPQTPIKPQTTGTSRTAGKTPSSAKSQSVTKPLSQTKPQTQAKQKAKRATLKLPDTPPSTKRPSR